MSSIIKVFDKRSGNTYFYESESYWDKEKQQPRSQRKLIGKLDPATGEMIPTDGRGKKRHEETPATASKPGPVPALSMARRFYGATYLLDQIGLTTGITDDLKYCFPDRYKKILSIAYFLILEDTDALIRFEHFDRTHKHPAGQDIPSQRSSELFQSLTEEAKDKFFCLQGKRRIEKEYWAYDTTSISSYSEALKQVKYGKNKDDDKLPQINLALLFGEKSGLPFYYRKLAGNIPDVKTMRQLIKDLDVLGYGKIKLCLDRGFYSTDNINGMYREHYKFIAGASTSLSYAKQFIAELGDDIRAFGNYNENYHVYAATKTIAWDYSQDRPYKGDTIKGDRRMYLHLYYNPEKAAEDEERQTALLIRLKNELLNGHQKPEHENQYKKFFIVHETPVRGIRVEVKEDAVRKARKLYGYFVLLSNEVKDPIKALELYRTRDVVEKAFGNLKERLNCRRMLTSSDLALEGKLFVEFIALIYLSYIKGKMQENGLFANYTMRQLLDELDVIECYEAPGYSLIVGEVLKKQEQLYVDLGVEPLTAKA